MHQVDDEYDEKFLSFIKDTAIPVIEEAEQNSRFVHFIVKGQVHIMDKLGLYEYGILKSGSYFGDISCMLHKPNTFSYFFNPHGEK